jgi:hypothetical protein
MQGSPAAREVCIEKHEDRVEQEQERKSETLNGKEKNEEYHPSDHALHSNESVAPLPQDAQADSIEGETSQLGSVQGSVVSMYLGFAGWPVCVGVGVGLVIMQGSRNFSDVWLGTTRRMCVSDYVCM